MTGLRRQCLDDTRFRKRCRESISDSSTITHLSGLGVSDGWRCLEVGAGYGSIAIWLARRVGSAGRVVATEIRSDCLRVLRGLSAEEGVEVRRHDIVNDSLIGCFDLIHARFVLEHIPQRDVAISRLIEMMDAGGWLVLEDTVFSGLVGDCSPLFERAMHAFAYSASQRGSDFFWAADTDRILADHGLETVPATETQDGFAGAGPSATFWASNFQQKRRRMVDTNLISDREVDEAIEELLSPRRSFIGPIVVTAIGRKSE